MTTQEKVLGFIDARGKKNRAARVRMNPLHEAAMRLADLRFGRARTKTKDLVGLLLCHGARSWRAAQPVARIRIKAIAPTGQTPVKIRFQ